jgi:hypothetical protein
MRQARDRARAEAERQETRADQAEGERDDAAAEVERQRVRAEQALADFDAMRIARVRVETRLEGLQVQSMHDRTQLAVQDVELARMLANLDESRLRTAALIEERETNFDALRQQWQIAHEALGELRAQVHQARQTLSAFLSNDIFSRSRNEVVQARSWNQVLPDTRHISLSSIEVLESGATHLRGEITQEVGILTSLEETLTVPSNQTARIRGLSVAELAEEMRVMSDQSRQLALAFERAQTADIRIRQSCRALQDQAAEVHVEGFRQAASHIQDYITQLQTMYEQQSIRFHQCGARFAALIERRNALLTRFPEHDPETARSLKEEIQSIHRAAEEMRAHSQRASGGMGQLSGRIAQTRLLRRGMDDYLAVCTAMSPVFDLVFTSRSPLGTLENRLGHLERALNRTEEQLQSDHARQTENARVLELAKLQAQAASLTDQLTAARATSNARDTRVRELEGRIAEIAINVQDRWERALMQVNILRAQAREAAGTFVQSHRRFDSRGLDTRLNQSLSWYRDMGRVTGSEVADIQSALRQLDRFTDEMTHVSEQAREELDQFDHWYETQDFTQAQARMIVPLGQHIDEIQALAQQARVLERVIGRLQRAEVRLGEVEEPFHAQCRTIESGQLRLQETFLASLPGEWQARQRRAEALLERVQRQGVVVETQQTRHRALSERLERRMADERLQGSASHALVVQIEHDRARYEQSLQTFVQMRLECARELEENGPGQVARDALIKIEGFQRDGSVHNPADLLLYAHYAEDFDRTMAQYEERARGVETQIVQSEGAIDSVEAQERLLNQLIGRETLGWIDQIEARSADLNATIVRLATLSAQTLELENRRHEIAASPPTPAPRSRMSS